MSAHSEIDRFSGDFSSFAHVLDCIYKSTREVHEGMINKIGFECLQSNLLTPETLALNQIDTLKFFRGLFWSRLLTSAMNKDITEIFQKWVKERENNFTGKVWLQILDISRLAEMPETFI